jgi:hypothetical protein
MPLASFSARAEFFVRGRLPLEACVGLAVVEPFLKRNLPEMLSGPMTHTGSRTWVARALSRGAHREEREYAKDYIKGKAGVNNEVEAMCSRTSTGFRAIGNAPTCRKRWALSTPDVIRRSA